MGQLHFAIKRMSGRVQNLVENAGHSPVFKEKIEEKRGEITVLQQIRRNTVIFIHFFTPVFRVLNARACSHMATRSVPSTPWGG